MDLECNNIKKKSVLVISDTFIFKKKKKNVALVKKNVVLIDEKHEGGDCQRWNFAQRLIRPCSWKDFKITFLAGAPFMMQISPKYFHSLKQQNRITFNLSQIFETHPSTSLLKSLLTLGAVASFLLVPKYISKVKVIF